jgi:hypothetical protein
MAVLTQDMDAETIKALLVAGDSKFFLVRSTNPRNTYRVLWYDLSSTTTSSYTSPYTSPYTSLYRSSSYYSRKCKVDILTPGTLNVPDVPTSRIKHIKKLPVAPILVVLFLKLQGWTDHCASTRSDLYAKRHMDVEDINQLVRILKSQCDLEREIRKEKKWLPASFIEHGKGRAARFVSMWQLYGDETWRALRAFLVDQT